MKTNVQKVMKFLFSFLILFGCTLMIHSQTLTFRVTNPKIGRTSTADSLEFNVEVKSTVAHYVDMMEADFYYNATAFGTNVTGKISAYGTGITGTGKYDMNTANIASGHLNFSIVSYNSWAPGDNLPDYYEQVLTGWTPLFKAKVKILDNTLTSGIYFYPTSTQDLGNQLYVDNTLGTGQKWATISLDETKTLQTLYLGRVFCGTYGWSQVGGTVDWSVSSINTSVWDTTAAPAPITGTNCQANNLRIHAGAALKIVYPGELKVTASTEINQPRGLWIASDATGTGAFMDNGEGSVTYNTGGYARIDRYVGSNNWHLIGFPLHNVNPQLSTTFLGTYLEWYNETMSTTSPGPYPDLSPNPKWTYVTTENPLTGDLKGWSHWATSDYTIKYAANGSNHLVSGAWTRGLTHTAYTSGTYTYDGWNLVANMYPCPIDWDTPTGTGWTRTSVDPTIYMWSQSGGNYAQYTYNGSGTGSTVNGGTRYIPSMQGFFVHVTAATTFGMDNNVKAFSSQAFWKDQTNYDELLDLNVTGNGYKDEAKVWFNNSATVNFEPEYDTYKLWGLAEAPQFYSVLADNNNAAINALPWGGINTVVPMGFSLKADAPVTITASNMESFKPGTRIYLEDKKVANTQELTVNPVYTFTASPNDDPNRFVLHFYDPSFGIEDKNLAGMQIYSFEDYVYVRNLVKGTTKGTIQIFDLIGRKVFQGTLKDMELNKYLPGVDEGYYMVRVVTEDNSYTKKVYLKY
jgi:hypothetical protein